MDLKSKIISCEIGTGVSKKTGKPYTCADVVFKGENGTVISKRIFIQDYEKPLLGIE